MTEASENRLSRRLGVPIPAGLRQELLDGLASAQHLGLSLLDMQATRRPGAEWRLALPSAFQDMLELAVAEARASGHEAHAEALVLQYVHSLPLALVMQQCTSAPPNDWLFHGPIDWRAMQRFGRGLAGLYGILAQADLDPVAILGASTASIWIDRFENLSDCYATTYFGSSFPMFAAHGSNLAALEAEVKDLDEAVRWAIVDYRLGGALLHEVLHFGRAREALFPPYLDEAVAGYLGVRLLRETAYPGLEDDNGLEGFPWFAQVGQALVRAFGLGPVLAAHAGARPWREVLGDELVGALDRLGWAAYRETRPLHFHPDTTRPDRWVKLFYLAARGDSVSEVGFDGLDRLRMCDLALPRPDPRLDREMLNDALAALCLERVWCDPVWRVRHSQPAGPVSLDFEWGLAEAPPRPGSLDWAARHVLPPNLCAERVAEGERRRQIDPRDVA